MKAAIYSLLLIGCVSTAFMYPAVGQQKVQSKPAVVSLSDDQIKMIKTNIAVWLYQNIDDPAHIEYVGCYDAYDYYGGSDFISFQTKLRITNSQGIKKLHKFNFITSKSTGYVPKTVEWIE